MGEAREASPKPPGQFVAGLREWELVPVRTAGPRGPSRRCRAVPAGSRQSARTSDLGGRGITYPAAHRASDHHAQPQR